MQSCARAKCVNVQSRLPCIFIVAFVFVILSSHTIKRCEFYSTSDNVRPSCTITYIYVHSTGRKHTSSLVQQNKYQYMSNWVLLYKNMPVGYRQKRTRLEFIRGNESADYSCHINRHTPSTLQHRFVAHTSHHSSGSTSPPRRHIIRGPSDVTAETSDHCSISQPGLRLFSYSGIDGSRPTKIGPGGVAVRYYPACQNSH